MKATIKDIARLAAVSETTVSLAFRENSRISQKTRKKILELAEKLHYLPNRAARSLRYGGLRTIGFIITDITNPFYAIMARIAETVALEQGYQVIISESNWEPDREVAIVRNMIESQAKGILLCSCEKTRESFEYIKRFSMPCIAVDAYPSFYKGPYVVNNVNKAGYMAAEHLFKVGCRNIAFGTANRSMRTFSTFQKMQRGFQMCCRMHDLSFDERNIMHAGLTLEEGRESFFQFKEKFPEIDGIFCVNDLCAIGVIEAADYLGIKPGRELAVIGIDNLNISNISRISLTSIRQPNHEIVETAVKALLDGIDGKKEIAIKRRIEPTLIVRSSSQLKSARVKSNTGG